MSISWWLVGYGISSQTRPKQASDIARPDPTGPANLFPVALGKQTVSISIGYISEQLYLDGSLHLPTACGEDSSGDARVGRQICR